VPQPGGKAEAHGGDRVKILSYFRMTGLGLVSRGLLSSIFDPTAACLGNVLFDTATCSLIEINRITACRKVVNPRGCIAEVYLN